MHKLFSLCFGILAPVWVWAQSSSKVAGRVTDAGKPVLAATVALISVTDSTRIKAAVTDSAGGFAIMVQHGSYRLQVSCIGFQKYWKGPFSIGQTDLDLGQIALLSAGATQLSMVTVSGKKPFVEHRIDRTVINVDALATNQGISAFDVLEKSPGILVDPVSGSINLEGKSGATVYINDKKSYLSGNDLVAYLQSLPSGTLDQIELMPNPPARYDAAGSGGVINIRLKKQIAKGFNGSATSLFGQWRYAKAEERFNFDYRSGKFNLTGNFDDNQQNYSTRAYQDRTYLNPDGSPQSYYALYNFTHSKGYTLAPQLGLDYYSTAQTTWGIQIGSLYKPVTGTGQTAGSFANQAAQPDSVVNQYLSNTRHFRSSYYNLNFRHQFDKKGHELTADFDYNVFNISNDQLFNNATVLPNQQVTNQSLETGATPSDIRIYVLKADYSRPLSNGFKLDAGVKTSFTHTDNPAAYFNTVNQITEPDYTKTNHFIYDENINAAYVNLSKDWKRFAAEIGLRAENTNSKGNQLGNAVQRDSAFSKGYTNLFPTLFVQYKLDSAGTSLFGFNYGRRVNRPNYQDLNPFIIPQDQFNYDAGSPYLNPSFAQSIEFSYTYHIDFTAKLIYGKTTGDIQDVSTLAGGILTTSPENLGYSEYKGISLSGSFSPVKWFRLNGFAQFKFEHTQALVNGSLENIYSNVGTVQGNIQFPMGKGWTTELNGFYQSATRNVQFDQNSIARLNAVFQKKFSNSFSARLVCTDFLDLFKYSGTYANLPLANASYKNTFDTRGFNISLTYRFGKAIKDLRNHRDDASNDEQNRVKN